jgi:hypothetical protein
MSEAPGGVNADAAQSQPEHSPIGHFFLFQNTAGAMIIGFEAKTSGTSRLKERE